MYKLYSSLSILSLLFYCFLLVYITFNLTQGRSFRAEEDSSTKEEHVIFLFLTSTILSYNEDIHCELKYSLKHKNLIIWTF